MRTFKVKLSDLQRAQQNKPWGFICFTIASMVDKQRSDIGDDSWYPRSKDVIGEFRRLMPECFSDRQWNPDVTLITSYLTWEFRRSVSHDEGARMALINQALEKHGDIELEFTISPHF